MPLVLEESIVVAASPEVAWQLLADPPTWHTWWANCLDAATADRKRLREGSTLVLELKPSWLRWNLRPKVEALTPPKLLLWSGQMAGLTYRHGWHLEPRANGTLVRQQLTLGGPSLPLIRLLRQIPPVQRMLHASLKTLRQLAERTL